mmetsp:Transcript_57994/g.115112  ORF Transcript_57994/g.115112 Transcript_57994/m.115112 type:complete len:247 (+) Transcript_57994:154-894(+)
MASVTARMAGAARDVRCQIQRMHAPSTARAWATASTARASAHLARLEPRASCARVQWAVVQKGSAATRAHASVSQAGLVRTVQSVRAPRKAALTVTATVPLSHVSVRLAGVDTRALTRSASGARRALAEVSASMPHATVRMDTPETLASMPHARMSARVVGCALTAGVNASVATKGRTALYALEALSNVRRGAVASVWHSAVPLLMAMLTLQVALATLNARMIVLHRVPWRQSGNSGKVVRWRGAG